MNYRQAAEFDVRRIIHSARCSERALEFIQYFLLRSTLQFSHSKTLKIFTYTKHEEKEFARPKKLDVYREFYAWIMSRYRYVGIFLLRKTKYNK